jgi:hypothetical protein
MQDFSRKPGPEFFSQVPLDGSHFCGGLMAHQQKSRPARLKSFERADKGIQSTREEQNLVGLKRGGPRTREIKICAKRRWRGGLHELKSNFIIGQESQYMLKTFTHDFRRPLVELAHRNDEFEASTPLGSERLHYFAASTDKLIGAEDVGCNLKQID